jgi:Ca2+-binding EF-hand superfamily protein
MERSCVEWKSSDRLTDSHIKSIFAEMDEKGNGWITSKEIEKRFMRLGLLDFSLISQTL